MKMMPTVLLQIIFLLYDYININFFAAFPSIIDSCGSKAPGCSHFFVLKSVCQSFKITWGVPCIHQTYYTKYKMSLVYFYDKWEQNYERLLQLKYFLQYRGKFKSLCIIRYNGPNFCHLIGFK